MTEEINLPWSASDIAKAVRELLAASKGGIKLVRYTADLFDHRRARQAAAKLNDFAFGPGGMTQPLARIARGDLISTDIDALEQMLITTAEKVDNSRLHLRYKYRDAFREFHGLEATLLLYDNVVFSKFFIRENISMIVSAIRAQKDADTIIAMAEDIIKEINDFNADLSKLHDLILPPKKKVSRMRPKRNKP